MNASLNSIIEGIEPIIAKKGTLLLKQGDRSSKSFYVKRGLLRSYIIDQKGKEHIFMFAPEGWIMADLESITHDAPAELYIEACEESEIIEINRNMFRPNDSDVIDHVEFIRLARRAAVLQQRIIMLLSAPALDRYHHFLKTYPQIVNRIPQKMIASYMGITAEALSKLRSDMVRGQ